MADAPLTFDTTDTPILLCPCCGFNYVHLDEVYVAGRAREDGTVTPVFVNSDGRTNTGDGVRVPLPENDSGRRHTISLAGWCENCHERFAIAFKQHKGQTHVHVLRQEWISAESTNVRPYETSLTDPA